MSDIGLRGSAFREVFPGLFKERYQGSQKNTEHSERLGRWARFGLNSAQI